MTHPLHHAESSVRRFGGVVEDYLPLHRWMDESKSSCADYRHRAVRHHAEGIFEGEAVFGVYITNADGKKVPVRYILEAHVKEDLGGYIPNRAAWLAEIPRRAWMSRGYTYPDANDDARRDAVAEAGSKSGPG